MWVSFHWVEANEFLAPEARESATARAAFAAGAHPDDLRVPLGGWRWSPDHPTPSWNILKAARVWNPVLRDLAPLREVASQAPLKFLTTPSTDDLLVLRPSQDGTQNYLPGQ